MPSACSASATFPHPSGPSMIMIPSSRKIFFRFGRGGARTEHVTYKPPPSPPSTPPSTPPPPSAPAAPSSSSSGPGSSGVMPSISSLRFRTATHWSTSYNGLIPPYSADSGGHGSPMARLLASPTSEGTPLSQSLMNDIVRRLVSELPRRALVPSVLAIDTPCRLRAFVYFTAGRRRRRGSAPKRTITPLAIRDAPQPAQRLNLRLRLGRQPLPVRGAPKPAQRAAGPYWGGRRMHLRCAPQPAQRGERRLLFRGKRYTALIQAPPPAPCPHLFYAPPPAHRPHLLYGLAPGHLPGHPPDQAPSPNHAAPPALPGVTLRRGVGLVPGTGGGGPPGGVAGGKRPREGGQYLYGRAGFERRRRLHVRLPLDQFDRAVDVDLLRLALDCDGGEGHEVDVAFRLVVDALVHKHRVHLGVGHEARGEVHVVAQEGVLVAVLAAHETAPHPALRDADAHLQPHVLHNQATQPNPTTLSNSRA
eukprot:1177781-Prorocentrum_minimum.AAC.2